MELQSGLDKITEAGATLVALSYDEPDALEEFARVYGITFPLLSDPRSEVIRQFGILNTLIAEDDHPWFGIPFPGTYVTDADGIITAKFFESHLALRPGVEQLIRAVRGEDIAAELALPDGPPPEQVECHVHMDDRPFGAGVTRELTVHLRVPTGQHLYGEPVPSGMVATSVEFDTTDKLLPLATVAPPTRPFTLAGTGETLQVYDGDVTLRTPVTHAAPFTSSSGDPTVAPTMRVAGVVRWQSCDDNVCGLPQSQQFSFDIPTAPTIIAAIGDDTSAEEMNSLPYIQAMIDRHKHP